MRRNATFMALGLGAAFAAAVPGAALAETLTFKPVADAHVDSAYPATSYGTATAMWVDSSPRKQIFLRFDVSGLAGKTVTGARLRLYQRDNADTGGRVFGITSGSWTESVTYDTRPAIDGPLAATFGPVADATYYEADVTGLVHGDGQLNLALDSTSSDGARWQSRESTTPPQLIVDAATPPPPGDEEPPPPPPLADGLTTVAPAPESSSDPTYYASNHRLAKTAGGRLLTIHGRHGSGIQLAWRDATSQTWSRATRGFSTTGNLISGTGTGDWPASIITGPDSSGQEHAWVVWAGPHSTSAAPLRMTRLSDLDHPAGPIVGPLHTVESIPGFRADVQWEVQPDGSRRAGLVWVRKNGDTAFEIVTGWLDSVDTDTPGLMGVTALHLDTTYKRFGTLVSTPQGLRAVIRSTSSRIRVYRHAAGGVATDWTAGATTNAMKVDSPAATALADGSLVAVSEGDTTNHVVQVQRFTNAGTPAPVELTLTGYKNPTIASDGNRVWIAMVRMSDGFVVSREHDPATGWTQSDRVEIGAEGGGWHQWPNLMREVDGRLRLVVRGPAGTSSVRSSTLALQRVVEAPARTRTILSSLSPSTRTTVRRCTRLSRRAQARDRSCRRALRAFRRAR